MCPRGQVCVYNATAPITDLPGRCMTSVLTCGGSEGKECKSGYQCLFEPKVDSAYRDEWKAVVEGASRDGNGMPVGICIPGGSLVVSTPWRGWGSDWDAR